MSAYSATRGARKEVFRKNEGLQEVLEDLDVPPCGNHRGNRLD